MLGSALLPFSSEEVVGNLKYDTIAEESLRGSVLTATESWGLWTEQGRLEEPLKPSIPADNTAGFR